MDSNAVRMASGRTREATSARNLMTSRCCSINLQCVLEIFAATSYRFCRKAKSAMDMIPRPSKIAIDFPNMVRSLHSVCFWKFDGHSRRQSRWIGKCGAIGGGNVPPLACCTQLFLGDRSKRVAFLHNVNAFARTHSIFLAGCSC